MSEYIGIVVDVDLKQLIMVIDPDADSQLDDPSWTAGRGASCKLVKIPRDKLSGSSEFSDLAAIEANIDKLLDEFK